MRQWFFGISALLSSCFATLGAVVISELHTEAGQTVALTTSYPWLWLGDAAVFDVRRAELRGIQSSPLPVPGFGRMTTTPSCRITV